MSEMDGQSLLMTLKSSPSYPDVVPKQRIIKRFKE